MVRRRRACLLASTHDVIKREHNILSVGFGDVVDNRNGLLDCHQLAHHLGDRLGHLNLILILNCICHVNHDLDGHKHHHRYLDNLINFNGDSDCDALIHHNILLVGNCNIVINGDGLRGIEHSNCLLIGHHLLHRNKNVNSFPYSLSDELSHVLCLSLLLCLNNPKSLGNIDDLERFFAHLVSLGHCILHSVFYLLLYRFGHFHLHIPRR